MTEHTPIPKTSRLDVISTGTRRRWTLEGKHRIVAENYSGPRLVSVTARRNGLSASQLFTRRRLARAHADHRRGDAATLTALVAALQRQCWAPIQSPLATIGLRIVDIPLSWFNDDLLDRIDLSPCGPSGPPRTLASPLLTTALAPVRLDRFGACRRSRAARRAWWRDHRRSG